MPVMALSIAIRAEDVPYEYIVEDFSARHHGTTKLLINRRSSVRSSPQSTNVANTVNDK